MPIQPPPGRRRSARLRRLLLCLAMLPALLWPGPVAAGLPNTFTDEKVADVPQPTALAFTPDGRVLVTSKSGQLRIIEGGVLLGPAAVDLSADICDNSERGLLGVAVDPNFNANNLIYLYYTFKKHGSCPTSGNQTPVNRVSRFTLVNNGPIDLGTETVLIDNIPSPSGNHNGGDIQFGNDGNLYVAVGDGAEDNPARRLNSLNGKILRITAAGGIPSGNPFDGSGTARCNESGKTKKNKRCREIFAFGLRNPFRIAFDPNAAGTRFFINDVGQDEWEEINRGKRGADYGWNECEGPNEFNSNKACQAPPKGLTDPIFSYRHNDGCTVVTGGAFIPDGLWPAEFNGSYLFADFGCDTIFKLDKGGNGNYQRQEFATQLGSVVVLAFNPADESLYYGTFAGGGEVHRIFETP